MSQHPSTTTRKLFPSSSSIPLINYYNFSSNLSDIKKSTIFGLIIGDCLGSTSEFKHPNQVQKLIKSEKAGWPFELCANLTWKKGESTDDSDVCYCKFIVIIIEIFQYKITKLDGLGNFTKFSRV